MMSIVLSIPCSWTTHYSLPSRNSGKSTQQLYPIYPKIGVFWELHGPGRQRNLLNRNFSGADPFGENRSFCQTAVFKAVSSKASSVGNVSEAETEPDTLYRRLSRLGNPRLSATSVLERWIQEGRKVKKWELQRIIKQLRRYRRYKHALEISEWIVRYRNQVAPADCAIRLDLIAKVHGIASAEKYFSGLPVTAKNQLTYGALLNSYVKLNLTEKSEAIMEKLKSSGFARNALPYNAMMTLYMNTDQLEKVPLVIQEMKKDGVALDAFSYNIWITACAAMSDIDKMEVVMEEVKCDNKANTDWTIYSTLATMYIKAGLLNKVESALKELENNMTHSDRSPYDYLISLYANIGNKEQMYRIWQSLKLAFPKMTNRSYICMLSSLLRIGDIEGAESILKEWESVCDSYDVRIPNIFLGNYVRKGLLEKAELLLEQILEKGGKPNFKTWEIMAEGYIQKRQIDQAIVAMKKSALVDNFISWQPKPENVLAILRHFEKHSDVESAEDFFKMLRGLNYVSTEIYNSLLRTYIKAGKDASGLFELMNKDSISPNEETNLLCKQACEPEEVK